MALLRSQCGPATERISACQTIGARVETAPALGGGRIVSQRLCPQQSHVWGWGNNYTALDGARIRSLSECQSHGGNHCEFIAWAENGCAALAVNGDNFYGWYGPTCAVAEQQALARNGGGHIEMSQCSS